MYSASDFEKLWFLYKTEGEPNGISINSFCVTHGVSYTHFNNWFRKTHKKIVPVQIDGKPSEECEVSEPVKEDIKKTIHGRCKSIRHLPYDYRNLPSPWFVCKTVHL